MNVEMFALYIFLHYLRFSNNCKNMYNLKITCVMPHSGNDIKHANLTPREIANFHKFANLYAHENVYIQSK